MILQLQVLIANFMQFEKSAATKVFSDYGVLFKENIQLPYFKKANSKAVLMEVIDKFLKRRQESKLESNYSRNC